MALFLSTGADVKAATLRRVRMSLWCASLCCAVAPGYLAAAPRVTVGETSFDFGSVPQGQAVTARFALENSGDEPLLVERMEFSVPAMVARVKQRLEPGETTTVEVTWNTDKLRREVEGSLTLYLNDPALPQLVLRLSGAVVPTIEFLPRPAFYFSQFGGERQTQSIMLKNNRDSPLAIEGLSPSSANFDASFREVEPGRLYELTVSTRPDTSWGRFRDSLNIRTSDATYPELRVEVNILIKPDVFVSSDVVDFGTLSLATLRANPGALDFVRQTLVIDRREGLMRLTSVTTGVPFLTVQTSPDTAANSFMVEVGLDPASLEKGPIEGSILVKTDDPKRPVLEIPVRGSITD
jgi:Protein of unknown function (DUF1573)